MEHRAAPALSRGLHLLQLLERDGQCSLEQLARRSELPKSSTLRLLQTLEACRAVARDPDSKRYRALLRLVPCEAPMADRLQGLAGLLPALAEAVQATAELHAWVDGHLVLRDRADPVDAEVRVVARIGFERGFDECDALTQVCRVWGRLRRRRHWTYDEHGERRRLAAVELAAIDARVASEGYGADLHPNSNGITRHALPVVDARDRLLGVLAIARTGARQASDVDAMRRFVRGATN